MERFTCDPYREPVGTLGSYIEKNVLDEFKLIYRFTDPRTSPPSNIPFNKIDLNLRYFIEGRSEEFIVEKKGDLSKNCLLDPCKSTVKVLFENHGLKAGILMCEFKVYTYESDMTDKVLTSVKTIETGIKLVE